MMRSRSGRSALKISFGSMVSYVGIQYCKSEVGLDGSLLSCILACLQEEPELRTTQGPGAE